MSTTKEPITVNEFTDVEAEQSKAKEVVFCSTNSRADTVKLIQSAKRQDHAMVRKILETSRKLIVNQTDDTGKAAIHYLSKSGQTEGLRLCLELKAKVDIEDKIGWTPLHYAAMNGHAGVVSILTSFGADPNKPDKQNGRSPLHLAVTRKHHDLAERLVELGADPTVTDAEGRSVTDLCKNENLLDKIHEAVMNRENEKGEISVEMNEIQHDKPAPFPNLRLTVAQKVSEDTEAHSFKMTIRRISPDSINDTFDLADMEDICSDAFSYTIKGTKGTTMVDINIPILVAPNSTEEFVLKSDKGDEFSLTNFIEEDEKWQCIASIDVTSISSFIVVSRPKVETFEVGQGSAKLTSTVDDRVQLDIPKGTFENPVTITMEITETPKDEELSKVISQYADISSTTAFYSLDSGGTELSKPISVKIPLPATFSGKKDHLVVLSMNESMERECPNAWTIIETDMKIRNNRVEFDVASFSIKVAVERQSPTPTDDGSTFGSTTTLMSQVSRLFRKSRQKEHTVSFVCASRRVGTSNSFKVVVKCCKVEQLEDITGELLAEGYEIHKFEDNKQDELKVKAKQRFLVSSKTHTVIEEKEAMFFEFHPKVDTYKAFSVSINEDKPITKGDVDIFMLKKKDKESNQDNCENSEEPEPEKVAQFSLALLTFDPKMLDEMDGRSFLSYKRMVKLQQDIGDVWWKVLVLMDIPFKTIEKTFSETRGSIAQKVNGMLFDWRERNRNDKSRGIPTLLSALCRSGRKGMVNDIQIELREWKNDPGNRKEPFYEWLIMAYRFDLLIPTRLDRPMSDTFIAMIADRVKPSLQVSDALSLPSGTVSDILANNKSYPTPELKCMKIMDHLRTGMSDNKSSLRILVKGLRKMKLNADADFVIMLTNAWIKRQEGRKQLNDAYGFLTDM